MQCKFWFYTCKVNFRLSLTKPEFRFAAIAFVIGIGYLMLEFANNRAQMADFRVYYDAASAFVYDGQVYGQAFGVSSGFYKYSPVACLPFVPFVFLPYFAASLIYYVLVLLSILWFMITITRESEISSGKSRRWVLLIVSLFMADHLERELHLGNVNLFLLITIYFVYKKITAGHKLHAGILYGVVLLFKPHFLILLPYWFWRREWKLMASAALTILIGIILPTLFKGWTANLDLLSAWMAAIRDHNVQLYESPNTVYGLAHTVLPDNFNHALLVPLLLALTGVLFLLFMLRNKKESDPMRTFTELFVLVALIPNLAHTDTEHFMWSWPLIAYSVLSLIQMDASRRWMPGTLLFLAFIPYCLNSPDIVGKSVRFLFDEGGMLGLANLVIIGVSIYLYRVSGRIATSGR
jgi:hypothetical protein